MNLTFYDWLILINPNTRLMITTEDGRIYKGKQTSRLNFDMNLVGNKIGNLTFMY